MRQTRTPTLLRSDLGKMPLRFVAAGVRPEQFYDSPLGAHHKRGEIALMCAVLDDALNCFQRQFVVHGQRAQRLAREAEEWMFSDDDRWPFSFVNICQHVGLDPAYLRQGLRQWQRDRSPQPPPRRQRSVIPPRQPLQVAA